jgi:hypothetical protein
MDNQNFNDQELSDIMKEIESLEENFAPESVSASPVVQKLAQMDEEQSIPKSSNHLDEGEVIDFEHHKSSSPKVSTSMSFKVEGDMTIDLQFNVGGKVVSLEVSESGLTIQMEGGVTFTVPVDSHKKSA